MGGRQSGGQNQRREVRFLRFAAVSSALAQARLVREGVTLYWGLVPAAVVADPIRVVYQIETAPAYTVSGKSPISEAMAVCGGVNVFASLPTLAATVGDVVDEAADVLLVLHERAEVQPVDALADVVVGVLERFERPPRADADLALELLLELVDADALEPAVRVVDEDDLTSAEAADRKSVV